MRLIDVDDLKKSLNFVYDCSYIESKSKEGIASDIIDEIDNAPTVEYTFEEAFQKTVCEQGLYCPKRPKGEWIEGENGSIKCDQCGCEIIYSYLIGNKPDFPKFCCDCGAKMK